MRRQRNWSRGTAQKCDEMHMFVGIRLLFHAFIPLLSVQELTKLPTPRPSKPPLRFQETQSSGSADGGRGDCRDWHGSPFSAQLKASKALRSMRWDVTDALSSADLRVAELGIEADALRRRIAYARRGAQHWKRIAMKLFLREAFRDTFNTFKII